MADTREQFSFSLVKYLELHLGDINDLEPCKSPIEKMMMWALHVGVLFSGGEYYGTIEPQEKIGGFTVDFLFTLGSRATDKMPGFSAKVVVECDGHDFHERTKEQASKDKERDRVLQQLGYHVFRYTGSDIWKDAMDCASEVIEFLSLKIEEQQIQHEDAKRQRYLAK